MSKEIDVSDPSSLSKEDKLYLQHRGQLPAGVDPVPNDLSTGESVPVHTGDANTGALTQEEWDMVMAARAKAQEEDQPSFDVSGGIVSDNEEDDAYDTGWTNDTRRAELSERGLSVNGSKEVLIARLRRSDAGELEDGDMA